MTGKERIIATLEGKPTDRAPLWLMDSFARLAKVNNNQTVGVDLAQIDPIDPWTEQWMVEDQNFIDVRDYYWDNCELFYEYKKLSPYGYCNRMMSIPDAYIKQVSEKYNATRKTARYCIQTPKGDLHYSIAWDKNIATPWQIEHPIKDFEDAKKLLSITDNQVDIDLSDFDQIEAAIGDRGVMMTLINTPMVTVSSAFQFEDYLVFTLTEPNLISDMIAMAYTRVENVLRQCLEAGLGPIFRIMGSEQATPPMGSPDIYHQYVHEYEKKMIALIHEYNQFAAVHCHGNIRSVLKDMIDAGVDLLDPVEAPPSGDISFADAYQYVEQHFREIAAPSAEQASLLTNRRNPRLTLAGNIQYEDLASAKPAEIKHMVKGLFADNCKNHKIVSCTGYPITAITHAMKENYVALIDAVKEYGEMEG